MENPSADVEMDQFETVSELPAEVNGKDAVEKMETDEKPKTEVGRKQAPPIEVKKELPVEDADWEIVSAESSYSSINSFSGIRRRARSRPESDRSRLHGELQGEARRKHDPSESGQRHL